MGPACQELTGVASKGKHANRLRPTTQVDACSLKLIGEIMEPIQVDAYSLKLIGELMKPIQVDACSLNLIGELMIHVFSFTGSTLTMMESQRTSSPQDYGEDYHKENFRHLSEYLEDSLDTGQTEDGLYKFKSIQDPRGPYSPSDPEYIGSSYYLLIEWEKSEITWEPQTNILGDVKHCGKSKARLVADGHLTMEPTETVYSGVVSLRNLRLAMFLVQLVRELFF